MNLPSINSKKRPRSLLLLILLITGLICLNKHGLPVKEKSAAMPFQPGDPELIRYGKELLAHTSFYLGPCGSVAPISNGMNCGNCHLEAGQKKEGIPLTGVYSRYPQYRDRSGSIESLYKRISDCFERSLDGKAPDSNSREYLAIRAYLQGLNRVHSADSTPNAALANMERATDPVKGNKLFLTFCTRCHGNKGTGQWLPDSTGYKYPPLWGKGSYNTGAGLYRIRLLARFIRYNMPFDKPEGSLILSEVEAWDLAAYINSQPRPEFDISQDWPVKSTKPVDYKLGTYADTIPATRHRYGPYRERVQKPRH